jgi:serine protease Do
MAVVVGLPHHAVAQPAIAVGNADVTTSRDAQYEQLAREYEALSRELGLVKRVVKLITPAVVHIEARPVRRESLIRGDVQEAGSGVLVDLRGTTYLLTNRHVIKQSSAPNISIRFADGNSTHPQRIWSDPETDVAVMSLPPGDYSTARLGDSSSIEIGEHVLAVGSPFGLSQSVTRGIISAKGRYNLELGSGEVTLQNFLQTDAAINPGNSGGPLINLRGEVIGLNTAIASNSGGNEGIGFSIPIDIAVRVAGDLVERGEVRRGYLGVTLDGLFDERRARDAGLPRQMGARVKAIYTGSPAAAAQLQAEDIIYMFGDTVVEDDDHLISLVQLTEVGRKIPVVVRRNQQDRQIIIVIGDEPSGGASN